MTPLLDEGSELPCWERDAMRDILHLTTRGDAGIDDFILRCEKVEEPDMPKELIPLLIGLSSSVGSSTISLTFPR